MIVHLLTSAIVVCSQLSGELVAPSPLYSEPNIASSYQLELTKQQAVSIEERYRAWYRVNIQQGETGWVRMLSVKLHSEVQKENSYGVIETINAFTGTQSTKSTGVRGFDETSFKNAKPNPLALAKMQLFAPSRYDVEQFVYEGSLTPAMGAEQ